MNAKTLLSCLFALAFLAPATVHAQTTTEPAVEPVSEMSEAGTVNADARAEIETMMTEARDANELATADGYIMAAEKYLAAAEVAKASGDDQLMESASGMMEGAAKAFVDAGSMYSDAEAHAMAAEQFSRAAEVAEQLENNEMQAQISAQAGSAFMKAEDFTMAIPMLDAAILLSPDELNYYYVRGLALRGSGDTEGYEAAFADLAMRADSLGDETMAARVGDTVGKSYLIEANTALKADQYSDAIASLDKAAPFLGEDHESMNKLYASAYYKMGVSQVRAEQFSSAQRSLSQAVTYGQRAGLDSIVNGAQAQLDYVRQVQEQG
ncbi:MAG: hypothetical protein HKN04_10985 [Rhodothermaceae bacterium]|nr:hypothetical protein [Rhodothermaceae bacterium]